MRSAGWLTEIFVERESYLPILEELVTELTDLSCNIQCNFGILHVGIIIFRVILVAVTKGCLGGYEGRIIGRENTTCRDHDRRSGYISGRSRVVFNCTDCTS
jgi:hypothetical protein